MQVMALDFGYWTAKIVIPLLTLGRMRVESPHEQLSVGSGDKRVMEKGAASVFGAFVFAALVTGAAVLVIGGPL